MKSADRPYPPLADIAALVPAAGQGTRLGMGPKAFVPVDGRTLLAWAVESLSGLVGRILIGVPAADVERARAEVGAAAEVHPGGSTRQETVRGLFSLCQERIVVLNDLVHPFVTRDLFVRVIEVADNRGAAMAFLPPQKPCGRCQDGLVTASIPAREIGFHQNPQAYHHDILARSFQRAVDDCIELQSTWELVVRTGVPVHAVPGDERNIKITTTLDWEVANKVIAPAFSRSSSK